MEAQLQGHLSALTRAEIAWRWARWIALIGVVGLPIAAVVLSRRMSAAMCPLMSFAVVPLIVADVKYRRAKWRAEAMAMQAGDFLFCPYCAYSVRDLPLPCACPECGAELPNVRGVRAHWLAMYPPEEGGWRPSASE